MRVTIPLLQQHAGYSSNLGTFEIEDKCPKCNKPRGKIFEAISYDGSRRLHVDSWINPCGHIDLYEDVRKEGKRVEFKAVGVTFNQIKTN